MDAETREALPPPASRAPWEEEADEPDLPDEHTEAEWAELEEGVA